MELEPILNEKIPSQHKFNKNDWKKWKEAKLLKKLDRVEYQKIKHRKKNILPNKAEGFKKCDSTVSIAVPGSICDNAQTPELQSYLAGQIARAAAIFCIDEVVIFNDEGTSALISQTSISKHSTSCIRLAKILQYLECPQYLRKHFFPMDKDLEYAGLLNPLDTPHHLRRHQECPFREGVVTNKPIKSGKDCSFVHIGLEKDVLVNVKIDAGLRVTVELTEEVNGRQTGNIISPLKPRQEIGLYWGYTVRVANSLGEVFTQCPYSRGYDLTVGTSERGFSVDALPPYQHAIIVFGGVNGLEAALENDEQLQIQSLFDLFDHYINTCPNQGSRTIRTEEAILVSLTALSKFL